MVIMASSPPSKVVLFSRGIDLCRLDLQPSCDSWQSDLEEIETSEMDSVALFPQVPLSPHLILPLGSNPPNLQEFPKPICRGLAASWGFRTGYRHYSQHPALCLCDLNRGLGIMQFSVSAPCYGLWNETRAKHNHSAWHLCSTVAFKHPLHSFSVLSHNSVL